MIPRFLVAALLAATMLPGSVAHAAGCEKIVTGAQGGDCTYVATGPGVFRVRTVSGYRVGYWRDGVWTTVSAKVAQYEQPLTGIAVLEGEMPSRAGDLVHLSVGVSQITTQQTGTLRYQNGTIEGRDGSFD